MATFAEGTIVDYPTGNRVAVLHRSSAHDYDHSTDGYPITQSFLRTCLQEWNIRRIDIFVDDIPQLLSFTPHQYYDGYQYTAHGQTYLSAPIPYAQADLAVMPEDSSDRGSDRNPSSDRNA